MVRQYIWLLLAVVVSQPSLAGTRFAEQVLNTSVRIHNTQEHSALDIVLKEKSIEALYDVDIDRFRDIRTGFNAIPKGAIADYQIKLTVSDHFCKLEDEPEEYEFLGVALTLDGKPLPIGKTNGNLYQAASSKWHELVLTFPTLEQTNDPFICYGIMVITAELSSSTI